MLFLATSILAAEEPTPAAVAGFNSYAARVESRLAEQHGSANGFLASTDRARLENGQFVIEQLTPANGLELPGALVHHWRGTAFLPGVTLADYERVLRDFKTYPRHWAPEVVWASVLRQDGDSYQVAMRMMQRHIFTVVLDATYDVKFNRLDAQHGYSVSRSTKIAEIETPGTARERALTLGEEHGFLWRMNSYWSYEEQDGGLYVQIESITLTRSVPTGLGWAIGPFIESIPRESLEFTLRATRDALKK